ncbi:hypothetical protein FH972_026928 [Carpinus fangiana]|uniref:Enoyl reductase (ER) domain-containing protein n=1 Tax=Carpinus fangiana TaxID=176857 RepID=A0A5N6L5P3_9ROSI|nr:hypothetical protein FH972_026928 [Carpinus fangiana]
MASTQALVAHKVKSALVLENVVLDNLQPDEALVEIHATGVCHTDLSCIDGTLPAQFPSVFGHEGGGIVKEIGSDIQNCAPGDKVLLSFAYCKSCPPCSSGHPAYCHAFAARNFGQCRTDGSSALKVSASGAKCFGHFFGQSTFARHAIVHASSIVRVPPDTPLELFAPLGCGMQTGSGAILRTLDVKEGSTVAVFGVGGVGMAAIMASKLRNAGTIIAIDLQPARLDLAKELGATHTIVGSDKDIIQQIQNICPPNGVNYAVECTGVPTVLGTMLDSLGTRGKGATIGAPSPGVKGSVDIFTHLVLGREYVGCCEGDSVPHKFIPYLIEQHKAGKFPLEKLITYYDIKDHEKAFADTKGGRTIKAVLQW